MQEVSKLIRSDHKTIEVNPVNLDTYLPSIIKCYGEPFAHAPSMWFLAKEISIDSKYTLSGDGADELFSGYYTHREASTLMPKKPKDCINLIARYYNTFLPETANSLTESFHIEKRLESMLEYTDLSGISTDNPIQNQLYIESRLLFPYRFLTYIDRLSMSHSVEPRSPFLDKNLWEFVMSMPDKYRIQEGVTKYILKKLAERYLPNNIVYRKKEGFVFPLYPYLIKNKESIVSRISELLDNQEVNFEKYISKEWAKSIFSKIETNPEGEYKTCLLLHTLNIIWHWNNMYINPCNSQKIHT